MISNDLDWRSLEITQITSLDWANALPMNPSSLALQWLPSLAQSNFVPWANALPMRCQLVASASPMTTHCRFNGNSLGISWQLDGNSLVSQSGIPTGKLHWPIVGKPTPIEANDFHHWANEVLLSGNSLSVQFGTEQG